MVILISSCTNQTGFVSASNGDSAGKDQNKKVENSLKFDYKIGEYKGFTVGSKGFEILITNLGNDINDDVEVSEINNSKIINKFEFITWKSNETKSIILDAGNKTLRIKPKSNKEIFLNFNVPKPNCSVKILDADWSGNWEDPIHYKIKINALKVYKEDNIHINTRAKLDVSQLRKSGKSFAVNSNMEPWSWEGVASFILKFSDSGIIEGTTKITKSDNGYGKEVYIDELEILAEYGTCDFVLGLYDPNYGSLSNEKRESASIFRIKK